MEREWEQSMGLKGDNDNRCRHTEEKNLRNTLKTSKKEKQNNTGECLIMHKVTNEKSCLERR